MEIIKHDTEEQITTVTVDIAAGDYQPAVEKQLRKARQTADIKGFRKGAAPMGMIKRLYGQSILLEEVNKIVTESLNSYVESENRDLIGEIIPCEKEQPVIDFENDRDFKFVYQAGFYPEFKLELNKDITLPYYEIIPTESEIDKQIEFSRQNAGKDEDVESIGENDFIRAETAVNDYDNEVVFLMSKIPSEQQSIFIGAKIDDEIEVEIRTAFPNEYDLSNMLDIDKEEIATLPEKMTFKITRISRILPAELDQEFFDKICGTDEVHNEEELRAFFCNQAKKRYEKHSMHKLYIDAKEVLSSIANISLPQDFLKTYFLYLNKDNDKVDEAYIDQEMSYLSRHLAWTHILNKLLSKNNIKVSQEEVVEEAKEMLMQRMYNYGFSDDTWRNIDLSDILRRTLEDREEVNYIITVLKERKLSTLLKDTVTLDIKQLTVAEFIKIYKDKDEPESSDSDYESENESDDNKPESESDDNKLESENENSAPESENGNPVVEE